MLALLAVLAARAAATYGGEVAARTRRQASFS
jgi:hypothetical protein